MVLYLFISNLNTSGINIDIKTWIIPIWVFALLLLTFIGFMEIKTGFLKEESEFIMSYQPQIVGMGEKIDKIQRDIEELKNKT